MFSFEPWSELRPDPPPKRTPVFFEGIMLPMGRYVQRPVRKFQGDLRGACGKMPKTGVL